MSVTPQFIGQRYKDTNTGNLWIANSLTAGDWTLEYEPQWISGTPSGDERQVGVFSFGDIPGLTNLIIRSTTTLPGYDIESDSSLLTLSYPNLVSIDPTNVQGGSMLIVGNDFLTTVSAPLLATSGNGVTIRNCQRLTTIDLSSFIPTNGTQYSFRVNALNAASVNLILARGVANAGYVSGGLKLDGGTNAAPTGQGVTDKNTLNARLLGLAVTN